MHTQPVRLTFTLHFGAAGKESNLRTEGVALAGRGLGHSCAL